MRLGGIVETLDKLQSANLESRKMSGLSAVIVHRALLVIAIERARGADLSHQALFPLANNKRRQGRSIIASPAKIISDPAMRCGVSVSPRMK